MNTEAPDPIRECEAEIKDLTLRAQQAERERDEAREQLHQLANDAVYKGNTVAYIYDKNQAYKTSIDKLVRERDEARELARNLYWAGWDLRRFARAYANGYDEADGKPGAVAADYAFYEASQNLATILGEETKTPPDRNTETPAS
jgi:chromatin remodeling complex protein RSC6